MTFKLLDVHISDAELQNLGFEDALGSKISAGLF